MPTDKDEDILDATAIASKAFDELAAKATDSPEPEVAEPVDDGKPVAEEKPEAKAEDKLQRDDNRDERGRFKAKDKADPDKTAAPAQAAETDAASAAPAADAAKAGTAEGADVAPPTSFSVAAKAAWGAVPPEVRAAIAKREAEVASGFAQYKEFEGIRRYAEMASRSGITLASALDNYTRLDAELSRDPAQGLTAVAQQLGWSQAQAAEYFVKAAQSLGYKSPSAAPQPGANGNPAGQGTAPELMQVLGPVLQQHLAPHLQEIEGLKKSLQQQSEASQTAQQRAADAIVAEFSADPKNLYYANLEGEIAALLTTGLAVNGVQVRVQRTGDFRRDLQAAYDQACKLHPEVSAALSKAQRDKEEGERKAKEQQLAEKARKAGRSVSGAASPGTRIVEDDGAPVEDARAIAARAYDALTARV
jgi:hypothetical protein